MYDLTLLEMDIRLVMRIESFLFNFWVGTAEENHWAKWSQEVKMIR
jgi:hypothetical protein